MHQKTTLLVKTSLFYWSRHVKSNILIDDIPVLVAEIRNSNGVPLKTAVHPDFSKVRRGVPWHLLAAGPCLMRVPGQS